jgi:hypothetical protein
MIQAPGDIAMAKKRQEAEKTAQRGRPKAKAPKPITPVVVTLRGKPEWVNWLDRLCSVVDQLGVGVERTQVIDYALKRLAQQINFPEPPPRV